MSQFEFKSTRLPGLLIARRFPVADARGQFSRLYCREAFEAAGVTKPLAQVNVSRTNLAGAIRGMHFQYPPHAETKVVTCLRGQVFDVVVDVRRGSPTFLSWHGEVLSAGEPSGLIIPEGCAHGFQALEDESELIYFHTEFYTPASEGALNALDPRLRIHWPRAPGPISERDRNHPLLTEHFAGVEL